MDGRPYPPGRDGRDYRTPGPWRPDGTVGNTVGIALEEIQLSKSQMHEGIVARMEAMSRGSSLFMRVVSAGISHSKWGYFQHERTQGRVRMYDGCYS